MNGESGVQLVSANLIKQKHNQTNTMKSHKFSSVGSYDNDESGFYDDEDDHDSFFKGNILEQFDFNFNNKYQKKLLQAGTYNNPLRRVKKDKLVRENIKQNTSFRRSISLSKENKAERCRDNVAGWGDELNGRIADKTKFNRRFEERDGHAKNIIVFSTKL